MDLKVSLSTGKTLNFKLPEELAAWHKLESDPGFQSQIRSLSLIHNGAYHALPAPSSFRRVRYIAEVRRNGNGAPAASRIGYVADNVMATLTLYFRDKPPMARFDLKKTGRLVWSSNG